MLAISEVRGDLQICRHCHRTWNHDKNSQVCNECNRLSVTALRLPLIYIPTPLIQWGCFPCIRPRRGMINLKISPDQMLKESPAFRVLSYNLLADIYASQSQHPVCPSWALEWGYRSQNLMREILEYGVDIMCLQEVQSNHYMEFFQPMFSKYGYEGFYKKKHNPNRPIVDGCATFIRRDRFKCLEHIHIEFHDLAEYVPARTSLEPEKRSQARSRFYKDNIAQVMTLAFKSYGSDNRVCIANTHIHSKPANRDVKLWQVNYLLTTLKQLVRKQEKNCNDCLPLILCGDFNSVPGSAVYSLLANGSVDPTNEDLKADPCGVLQQTAMFQHNLPLASAYSSYNSHSPQVSCAGEPKFTTFAYEFKGTLDYIFYSRTNLKVDSLLELIDESQIASGPNFALPSPDWSSDHIALLAQFRWCNSSSSLNPTMTACTSKEMSAEMA